MKHGDAAVDSRMSCSFVSYWFNHWSIVLGKLTVLPLDTPTHVFRSSSYHLILIFFLLSCFLPSYMLHSLRILKWIWRFEILRKICVFLSLWYDIQNYTSWNKWQSRLTFLSGSCALISLLLSPFPLLTSAFWLSYCHHHHVNLWKTYQVLKCNLLIKSVSHINSFFLVLLFENFS